MTDESRADIEREAKLVGVAVGGGGIPLPLAFDAVAKELLMDHDYASTDDLTAAVEKALKFKEKRLFQTAWRTWGDFTQDVLDQLEYREIIRQPQKGLYDLGHAFMVNTRYLVIPKADIGFTAWDEESLRERRDNDAFEADLRALMTQYQGMHLHEEVTDAIQNVFSVLHGVNAQPVRDVWPPKPESDPGEFLVCTICGYEKSADQFEWEKKKTKKDGKTWYRRSQCTPCRKSSRSSHRGRAEVVRDFDPSKTRACRRCEVEYPLTSEHWRRTLSREHYTVVPTCRHCTDGK